jgi:ribosomal protein L44E
MQHVRNGRLEEHGCFVYRILRPVAVRTTPTVGDEYKTGLSFATGDLVSVDFIRPSPYPGSENGPFVRLSDYSGWLFETKGSQKFLERLVVTDGLWTFYVDNHPVGMHLRRHPFDKSPKVEPPVSYEPMQLIYFDQHVATSDGGNSYRVQGTQGWVFDKRNSRFMLLPESSVRSGLFAFQVLQKISIRSKPDTADESRTLRSVTSGEVVCGDLIRESPYGHENGPFVRLTDGSGWVFVRKNSDPEPILKEILVETGSWTFKILNHPTGLGLRRQPIDRCGKGDMKYETVYDPNTKVKCDRRVAAPTGVNFYRVQGTQGWIFDRRGGEAVMELLKHHNTQPTMSSSTTDGWSIDFVRGAAIACDVEEIMLNPQSCVISFRTRDSIRINVYYTTRTIGTAMSHPTQGNTQLFRKNCTSQELVDIPSNPRIHTGRGYKKRSSIGEMTVVQTQHGPGVLVEEEEELRQKLLEVDEKFRKLWQIRMGLLTSLKPYEEKRADAAAEMKENKDKCDEEMVEMQREIDRRKEKVAERQREVNRLKQNERKRQLELTCDECHRVFSSDHARDQHLRDAHGLICGHCDRIFKTHHSLHQHVEATGHW